MKVTTKPKDLLSLGINDLLTLSREVKDTIIEGIRKVDADTKPFSKTESHFADAKFYTKSEDISEFISTEVPMTKGTYTHEQGMITTKKSNKGDAPNGQQNDEPTTQAKSEALESEKDNNSTRGSLKSPYFTLYSSVST
ncbi:ty3-gypsy retrotransposon protein [Cucumis melo var. makuwa]|uniref:Ty3-gypsy retrotransposon protein n=1 Tax=Cucumis melo var. makuwa TaxID=1194695 RepID=A0A5D3D6I7_CUCMM|nr:ty3-gypsy retrotransposon protein [Cucumis melo var. makuwa]